MATLTKNNDFVAGFRRNKIDSDIVKTSSATVIDLVSHLGIPMTRENVGILYISSLRKSDDHSLFVVADPSTKNGYTRYDPSAETAFEAAFRRISNYGMTGQMGIWIVHYIVIVPRAIDGVYYTQDPQYKSHEDQLNDSYWAGNDTIRPDNTQMDNAFQTQQLEPNGHKRVDKNRKNDLYQIEDPEVVLNEIRKWCNEKPTKLLPRFDVDGGPRSYQRELATKFNKFCDRDDLSNVFYLLAKPRAGKNLSALLALWVYVNSRNLLGETVYIHFLSLWPSAFKGFCNDLDKFQEFAENFCAIDTSEIGWEKKIQKSKVNILMCSMQSLGEANNVIHEDNIFDDISEEVASNLSATTKISKLKKYKAEIRIIDEADHGMRTENSESILKQLECNYELWMSGSDFYALAHLANEHNSLIFDVVDEQRLVAVDPEFKRPKIITHTIALPDTVYQQCPETLIDDGIVSRRLSVIMATNMSSSNGYHNKFYKKDGRWHSGGNKVIFKNLGTVESLFLHTYVGDGSGRWMTPSLLGLKHGYCSMPSVASMYAFDNMVQDSFQNLNLDIAIANEMGDPSNIEANINDWLDETKEGSERYGRKTLTLAKGKLRRGATVEPWTFVMRYDDSVDLSINLQINFRCQSGNDPEVYVFDCNPLRAMKVAYGMAHTNASIKGDSLEETLRALLHAQPIFMPMDEFGISEELDLLEIIKRVRQDIQINSFRSESLFNSGHSLDITDILGALSEVSDDDNTTALNVLDPQVNPGKAAGKKIKTNETDKDRKKRIQDTEDELGVLDNDLLKIKCKNILRFIPLLMFLNQGNQSNVNELINDAANTSMWCKHIGTKWNTVITLLESDVFDLDVLDSYILICSDKLKSSEFVWNDIKVLITRGDQADVPVPETLAKDVLSPIKGSNGTFFDFSCGDGELVVQRQLQLISDGMTVDEANKTLYFADESALNVKITEKRLGGNIDNGHSFTYNREWEVKMIKGQPKLDKQGQPIKKLNSLIDAFKKRYSETFGDMKFTNIGVNPPFQGKGENGGHGLWQKFAKLALDELLEDDGHLLYISPKWIGLGLPEDMNNFGEICIRSSGEVYDKSSTTDYSIFYKYQLETLVLMDDKKAKQYFDVGSSFSWYHIIKTEPTHEANVTQYLNDKVYNFTRDFTIGELIPPNITPKLLEILDDIYQDGVTKVFVSQETMKQSMETKECISDVKTDEFPYSVYRGVGDDKISYTSIKSRDYDKIKVMIPITSEYKKAFIAQYCNQTHDIAYVTFDTMADAEVFLAFVHSEIPKLLRLLFSMGRKNCPKGILPKNINVKLSDDDLKYLRQFTEKSK